MIWIPDLFWLVILMRRNKETYLQSTVSDRFNLASQDFPKEMSGLALIQQQPIALSLAIVERSEPLFGKAYYRELELVFVYARLGHGQKIDVCQNDSGVVLLHVFFVRMYGIVEVQAIAFGIAVFFTYVQ